MQYITGNANVLTKTNHCLRNGKASIAKFIFSKVDELRVEFLFKFQKIIFVIGRCSARKFHMMKDEDTCFLKGLS